MTFAAFAASCARRSGDPLLAISPAARSRIAVDLPSICARISVPPAISSISSGWAPIARMSTRVMAGIFSLPRGGVWSRFGGRWGGRHPEEGTDAAGTDAGARVRADRHAGIDVHRQSREAAKSQSDDDTKQATETRERRCFDEKLQQDFFPRCTKRFPDSNLARAAGDRDHHDRHHANPANQ